jgi:hypothetical protein
MCGRRYKFWNWKFIFLIVITLEFMAQSRYNFTKVLLAFSRIVYRISALYYRKFHIAAAVNTVLTNKKL